jgi:regulator of sigma E protease
MIQTPGFLWTVLFFLLALGPLIFAHELGHYLVGRWFGVKADVFSIGFGRELTGWTDRRGTRWKVGWMPLGGYVKFAGDMNAASTPSEEWKALPEAERAVTFQAKPLWQRALIVLAGPVTNFVLAVLIFMGIFAAYGQLRTPPVVGAITKASAAERAGFQLGDQIAAINGRPVRQFLDVATYVEMRPGEALSFSIVRGGKHVVLLATPDENRLVDRFGNKTRRGLLGIGSTQTERVRLGVTALPGAAIRHTANIVRSMVDGITQIVMGRRPLSELGGPIMIAKYSGQTATLGFAVFLGFVAMISINLGFINLLPIPMLDGGHLLFYSIEGVIRRPVPPEAQEWAFRSGFVALMALMLFVTVNDLSSLNVWQRLTGLIG